MTMNKQAFKLAGVTEAEYKRWCKDNLEIPLSQKTFSQYLTQNAGAYGILYSKHVIDNQRGFKNILVLIDPD